MPMFYIEPKFHIDDTFSISLIDFHTKSDLYEKRPPYQRKNVWNDAKKKKLIDSIFRGYFIPRIIIRRVIVGEGIHKYEIVDGQQRVQAIQDFLSNKFKTTGLSDIRSDISNKYFNDLPIEVQDFIKEYKIKATLIDSIGNPKNKEHQKLITQIFWRVNDGTPLNRIEKDHSKIYSAVRNFVVKYADDISFNYDTYVSQEFNIDRHNFFKILNVDNKRLKHLALLARLLLIESKDGPTDVGEKELTKFIDRYETTRLEDFENTTKVRDCIKILHKFHEIFKDDLMIKGKTTIHELDTEYFIISFYLLLRHLEKYYVFDNKVFSDFLFDFYQKWASWAANGKYDILIFRENRQQDKESIEKRDMILRLLFFSVNQDLKLKDMRRSFNEAERIHIYRKGKGLCEKCKEKGKSDSDAFVPWREFDADHIKKWIKGGNTNLENARLLCRRHNRSLNN